MRHRSLVTLVLAVAGLCCGVPAQSSTVAEWAAALQRPGLVGAGLDAAGRTFTWGHLTLADCAGRVFPVVALDQVVGFYLHGTGTATYASPDPLELATFRTNVARVTSYKLDAGGVLRVPVEGALVLLSHGAAALSGEQPWREGATPPAAADAFAKHLERFAGDQWPRYPQLMAQALVDPPATPLVVAELATGKKDLAYVLDPLRDHDESIFVLEKTKNQERVLKNKRFPENLSSQPVGRTRLQSRPRRFALVAVDVAVTNPEKLAIEVEATETFVALAPLRTLELAAWSSRYVFTGPSSMLGENPYRLASATLADGQVLPFTHANDDLVVELPRPLAAGERVTLRFKLSGEVAYRPGGDNYWWLGESGWFPSPARPDMPYFTYHATCKVPKPFIPFSCGRTVRRWEEGTFACAEFREDNPIHYTTMLAGKYTTISEERGDVTLSVSSYGGANQRGTETILKNVGGLLEFYQPFLGTYPFPELKIVEINDLGFGMAPPGVIFITKEAFSPLQDEDTQLFSDNVNARLAHEVAHTWWGHVAMRPSPEDQWIAESVAEYYAAFAMGRLWKASKFDKALGDWKGISRFARDRGTIYLANYLSGEEAFSDRFGLLYGKGPLMLHALRQELGDQVFFTLLKSFISNFRFKWAETAQFIRITSVIAKKDYQPWFDRYLLGTESPKL